MDFYRDNMCWSVPFWSRINYVFAYRVGKDDLGKTLGISFVLDTSLGLDLLDGLLLFVLCNS